MERVNPERPLPGSFGGGTDLPLLANVVEKHSF